MKHMSSSNAIHHLSDLSHCRTFVDTFLTEQGKKQKTQVWSTNMVNILNYMFNYYV